jgi:hypothetical protein
MLTYFLVPVTSLDRHVCRNRLEALAPGVVARLPRRLKLRRIARLFLRSRDKNRHIQTFPKPARRQ